MGPPSTRGIVSAATPEAAAAGAKILAEGGNAVDAAVAVALVLGVTEPAGSGIGGQSTFIVHAPHERPFVINGTSFAPRATPRDAALVDLVGHRATTVPTQLRVLDAAWTRYGSGRIPWARLVEPAIGHAGEGYALGPFRRRSLLRHARSIRQSPSARRILLDDDGAVPGDNAIVRHPELAATLERIAREGAHDFYDGDIARRMVRDVAEHGGWLSRDDLRALAEPAVIEPLRGTYRGWTISTLPPPASGWVVLVALNLLERAPAAELSDEDGSRIVWLAEALRYAHRERHFRPVRDLLAYQRWVEAKLSKHRAERIADQLAGRNGGETTHFSIADREGRVVGVTQSLNSYYGARVAAPDLGFLYNDYMREFVTGPKDHPYALAPGAMPYSSMSASVLSRDDIPWMIAGSPANERIISAVVQVISHWVDVGGGIRAAVAAPRLHTLVRNDLLLEVPPAEAGPLLELESRGFSVLRPLSSLFTGDVNPYFGGVHAVALQDGRWEAAADPRRDGAVAREA